MQNKQSMFRAGQALGLLSAGAGLGFAISTMASTPDDAAAIRALEQRLAALERVIAVSADGVVIGNRNANLTVRQAALQINGKTVTVSGVDKATIESGTQARFEMIKAGDVSVNGRVIDIKGTKDVLIKGSKITNN
jgi:hypothetical protein